MNPIALLPKHLLATPAQRQAYYLTSRRQEEDRLADDWLFWKRHRALDAMRETVREETKGERYWQPRGP